MADKKHNGLWWLFGISAGLVAAYGFKRGGVEFGEPGTVDPGYFSKYIDIDEVGDSAMADDHNIDNSPSSWVLANARTLAQWVLDPLTEFLGAPPVINSWYRNPQVNALVGGANDSDHMTGGATDLEDSSGRTYLIIRAVLSNDLPFDQMIIYGAVTDPDYIHISIDPNKGYDNQAKQILQKTTNGYAQLNTNQVISQVL